MIVPAAAELNGVRDIIQRAAVTRTFAGFMIAAAVGMRDLRREVVMHDLRWAPAAVPI